MKMLERRLCACGCGGTLPATKRPYPKTKYLRGHAMKILASTKQHRAINSARVERLWKAGKMKGPPSGHHGFGRNARDLADHASAKFYVVRDPAGRIHQIRNLSSWARRNVGLFVDHQPTSKGALAVRFCNGIRNQGTSGRPNGSWYGWVLVSLVEQAVGAADPLRRTAQ